MTPPEKPARLSLEDCVRNFLDIALVHPEKPPKTQRAARENEMLIVGYNRAQENLRTILEQHGRDKRVRAIAEVRNENQRKPVRMGGVDLWLAS